MNKIRLSLLSLTVIVLATLGIIASLYARGYRFDSKNLKVNPNGLLVVNSPTIGAQLYINGELKSATNSTISLSPGTYDIKVKKEGYTDWDKRIEIQKEIVTEIEPLLFPSALSLSALTFNGVFSPVQSPDLSKIVYANKEGLWLVEVVDLPLGFSREPRIVTDGDLSDSSWEFSPDSREILLTTKLGAYLLDLSKNTPQPQRTNISSQKKKILSGWQEKKQKQNLEKLARLPLELREIFTSRTSYLLFSPDEQKILYTASESATIAEGLVKPLPGASSQKQVRVINIGNNYIYDIKEDRNFLITDQENPVLWLTNSRNVLISEKNKIFISDYDGTNKVAIYSGSYVYPFAFPSPNANRLIILTSLGSDSEVSNLYSINLK